VSGKKPPHRKNSSKPAARAKTAPKGTNRWQRGQSGNPKGRPQGSLNKATIFAKEMTLENLGEIIAAMHKAAVEGNVQAQKFLISRVVPPARSQPLEFELPPIETPKDIVKAFDAIWTAVGAGEISLEDMDRLRFFLESKQKAIEGTELAAKIERIEAHLGTNR
jgi:hypothetical protein